MSAVPEVALTDEELDVLRDEGEYVTSATDGRMVTLTINGDKRT